MKAITAPVTHLSYSGCVTTFSGRSCTSETRRASWCTGYADRTKAHRHAGARVRMRASACAYMRALSNYVTKKKEKKEQQVKAAKPGYAAGYARVTRRVTGPASHSSALRTEVTHV